MRQIEIDLETGEEISPEQSVERLAGDRRQ